MKQYILSAIPSGARQIQAFYRQGVHVELYHLEVPEGDNFWEIFKFTKGPQVAIEARGQEPVPSALVPVKLKCADSSVDANFGLLVEGNRLCGADNSLKKN